MSSYVVFDIESGPRPLEEIQKLLGPFDPVSKLGPKPGEFDPSTVKLGNLKDQAKIDEKIESARSAWNQAREAYDAELVNCEQRYWAEVVDRAALDATLGEVLAIGYRTDKKTVIHHADEMDEAGMLRYFWEQFEKLRRASRNLVGHYSNSFDVQFIARRSWLIGVQVPSFALSAAGWLDQTFVDIMARWQFGNKRDSIKLDTVARALGHAGKPEGMDGSMFHELYRSGDKVKKQQALDYLANDLDMTWFVAEKLGV